jgi:hypothetical protein
MVSDEQLVFFIAIPGSGWAKIDSLLRNCSKLKFNMSDHNDERWERIQTKGPGYYVEHKGHFLGPGTGFGEGLDNIPKNYTKEQFKEEVLKVYSEVNDRDNFMIKCHWFCEEHNLKWLTENFPNNKMIFVLRDKDLCDHRWLTSMTFNKNYPSYKRWMVKDDPDEEIGSHCKENQDNFKRLNEEHNIQMRKFIRMAKKPTMIFCPTRYLLDKLDFVWDANGEKEFGAYTRNYMVHGSIYTRSPSWDTSIVFYNCTDILDIV